MFCDEQRHAVFGKRTERSVAPRCAGSRRRSPRQSGSRGRWPSQSGRRGTGRPKWEGHRRRRRRCSSSLDPMPVKHPPATASRGQAVGCTACRPSSTLACRRRARASSRRGSAQTRAWWRTEARSTSSTACALAPVVLIRASRKGAKETGTITPKVLKLTMITTTWTSTSQINARVKCMGSVKGFIICRSSALCGALAPCLCRDCGWRGSYELLQRRGTEEDKGKGERMR